MLKICNVVTASYNLFGGTPVERYVSVLNGGRSLEVGGGWDENSDGRTMKYTHPYVIFLGYFAYFLHYFPVIFFFWKPLGAICSSAPLIAFQVTKMCCTEEIDFSRKSYRR